MDTALKNAVAKFYAEGLNIEGMHLRVGEEAIALDDPSGPHPPGSACWGCGDEPTPDYWFNGMPACVMCVLEAGQYVGAIEAETFGLIRSKRDKRKPWDWRHEGM